MPTQFQDKPMAIKKSELYSSLWESCDLLRGGMDASQYKDYVLVLLFIKYVSDKYAGQRYAPITIPEGASFADMVALKGKADIGDQINKKIVGPLATANKLSDMPDFNDSNKLGQGKDMVERLTHLIAVFESPDLDFSKNRADGDDILGDAYEYLMRHFATESGKSKGQFYTPAEVSRILAAVIGIGSAQTSTDTTVYDPTCGSGSLLLKVGDSAPTAVTLYGQEKDSTTSGLARMNMILHDNATALIAQGNTLTDPKFKDGDGLKTFDFVVANPPFSDKRWSTGLDPINDPYRRFDTFGVPPAKQGDYAYLLHIVRSLKSTGKGACILPHGVLFRGNAEGEIRKNLIRHGYIKGIIGLPANLFYGTGIPACIVVIDKANAKARKGIFMVDASQGFIKDGPKNRLREQDIHRIVDVFNHQDESDPRYARTVGLAEIEKNDFNLNLPRYIDSSVAEDIQDINGHLQGGIPLADVEALDDYWAVCPQLKGALFKPLREGYATLSVDKAAIKLTIFEHPQFAAFLADMGQHFDAWRARAVPKLKALDRGFHPKQLIVELADGLLQHYEGKPLIDAYDVYQHLMDYWAETMQDDAYLLAADGWVAQTYRVIEKTKKGKGENAKVVEKDKGWACDLVPKQYIVARYFAADQKAIDETSAALEAASSALAELEEENSGEEAVFSGFDKINAAAVKERIKEIGKDADAAEELAVLKQWQSLSNKEAGLKKALKTLEVEVDAKAYARYPKLTVDEIKTLVVEDKWLAALSATVSDELARVSQKLTSRVRDLASRYESPLPVLVEEVATLSARVEVHLRKMGAAWN
ncbi:type I restriction-modification system, M subunit [Burkholderia pseudomallei]|nr:type I restriction-modification system, M subunit [Burkholderia pseudomallei]